MSSCDSTCIHNILMEIKSPLTRDPNFWLTLIGTISSLGSIVGVLWIKNKVIKALTRRHRRDFLNQLREITNSIANLDLNADYVYASKLAWRINNEFSRAMGLFDDNAQRKFRIKELTEATLKLIEVIETLRPQNSAPVSSQTVYNGSSQAFYTLNSNLHHLIGALELSEDTNG